MVAVAGPVVYANGTLNSFSTTAGTPSAEQTFTVSGYNLTGDLSVTPPAGMEIRTSGSYSSSPISLTPTSGTVSNTTVTIRVAGSTAASSLSGNVTVSSSGATNKTLAVTGTVSPDTTPFVSASTNSLAVFSAFSGSVSSAQTFTATAKNLTNAFTVTAPGGFQLSTNGVDFTNSLTLAQTNGLSTNTISVRVAGTNSAGTPSGNVVLASSGATSANVAVTATVSNATLTVTLNPALMAENSPSTGTVSVPAPRVADLTINLTSGTTSAATVPPSVTLTAGQTNITFTATGVNDPGYAERSSVITASATNCNNGIATLTVVNVTPAPITPIALGGSGANNTYSQNFNGLGTNTASKVIRGSNGVIVSLGAVASNSLNGWYAARNSGSSNTTATDISINTNSSTGTLYNFGPLGDNERALGSIGTGTTAMTFGALFTNTSAGTITNVRVSLKGEFWRSSTSVTNVLTNSYGKVDGTNVTTINFLTATSGVSTASALNIVGPAPVVGNGPLDGTLTVNQTNLSSVSLPLVLLAGEVGFVRWQDVDDGGSDAGLAIDDFVLTYDVDTNPQFTSFSPGSAQVGGLVTILGANFTTNTTVSFNGTPATAVTLVNPSQLSVAVPDGATTGVVYITEGGTTLTSSQAFLVGNFQASVDPFGSTTLGGTVSRLVVSYGNGLPGSSLILSIDSNEFQAASANLDAGFSSGYGASAEIPVSNGAVDSFSADYFVIQFTPTSAGTKNATATLSSGGVIVGQLTLTGSATGLPQPSLVYGFGQNGQVVLAWTNSANFANLVLLGREGSAPGSPGADENLAGNSNFPTANLASNGASVLFTGTGDAGTAATNTITGLTNNRFYHFTLFNRDGTNVSTGVTYRLMPYADLSNRITQWNFNSSNLVPSLGSGTATAVGGVTPGFVNGVTGSSDRASTNKAVSIKGSNNTFTGLQFAVSTAGKTGIKVSWDLAASGTAAKHYRFQYTLDATAATPMWVNYAATSTDSPGVAPDNGLYVLDQADTTLLQRSADLSGVSGVENNAKFGFRILNANAPGTNVIARADGTSAAYSSAGTTKYDMVTVLGVDGTFNSAPTDLALSASSIAENNEVGALVGTFSTVDPDAGDTFTYSFHSGLGLSDNSLFEIVGNELRIKVVANYETKASYTVRVRSTDSGGLSSSTKEFVIAVTDVNENTSFAGWLGTNAASAELVQQYAFGAVSPTSGLSRSNLPAGGISGSDLTLTYFVRAEATNPNLVTPQWHTNLEESNAWTAVASSNITTVGTHTVNGVQVIQRRATVPVDGTRKFLRLKIAE